MFPNDGLRRSQAETKTSRGGIAGFVEPIVGIEDAVESARWDTGPAIANLYDDGFILTGKARFPEEWRI